MTERLTKKDLPSSLGAFRTVVHVMAVVPDEFACDWLAEALHADGSMGDYLLQVEPHECSSGRARTIGNSSEFVGLGREITLKSCLLDDAGESGLWMLVHAPDNGQAGQVQRLMARLGIPEAVRDHRRAVEDLV